MTIQHRFVDLIPKDKDPGVIYISLEFAVASHLCPCGCGNLVVTALAPHAWSVTFDGESISLSPSIGNFSLSCKSHYWIRRNQIRWARALDEKEMSAVRLRDERAHKKSNEKNKKGKKKPKARGQSQG
jgi:hypothetical protein